jgi:hypothetical protein
MTDWILVGAPSGGPVALAVSDATGPAFVWSPSYVAAMLGQRFVKHWQLADPVDLRACTKRWVGADGEPVDDAALDGASLVSANGARVPLAQAVSLLGLEQPEAFVEASPAAAPSASPARASNTNGVPADGVYSSRKGGAHLPGKSRRWMLDHAREIPGASKIGRDWIVPYAAYERWRTEQDAARCRATASIRTPDADARTIAERTLANAGLRPTRGL